MKTHPYTVIIPQHKGDPDEMRFWWWDRMSWLQLNCRHAYDSFLISSMSAIKPGTPDDPVAIGPITGKQVLFTFENLDEALMFKLTFGGA